MDYILSRINNDIAICDEDSYEYVLSLRKRIEYVLYSLMGCLWSKNSDELLADDRLRIISSFDRMSIGDFVSAIMTLDIKKEVLSTKKARSLINDYPSIRNLKIGHGYTSGTDVAQALVPFYEELISCTSFLREESSIIIVEKFDGGCYRGIRIDCDGKRSRWACPKESFPCEGLFPRTYMLVNDSYYKLSPFLSLFRNGADVNEYAFSSLTDSLTGSIKLCPLFGNKGENTLIYNEFAKLCEVDEYRQVSANGTVMNCFERNYTNYIDVGLSKEVKSFLTKNRANVSATLWGHGGVGKTACIQNVCEELFCEKDQVFSYIVFVTAKDRIYNSMTGKVTRNASKYVRRYEEIIDIIAKTVFPGAFGEMTSETLHEAEQRIQNYSGKILIVIDDYETFIDEEKIKITNFIKLLDIDHHKVVITTRNIRLSIGTPIPTNEFDAHKTCMFLERIVNQHDPALANELKKELTDSAMQNKVLAATSGRPIFIYQFAYLFMQKGLHSSIFSELSKGTEANNFLYGRVFEYLTDPAKLIFASIPAVINDDLLFRFDMLRYVTQKELPDDDKFELAIEELTNQLVVERYNDSQGRVYAQELLSTMKLQYDKLDSSYKEAVRRLLESLGGKEISGTIEEAMLHEADQSRVGGNATEIISKYRRVLNLKDCPRKIRKQALLNATSYLSVSDLNPKGASDLVKEYLNDFKDDPQIAYQYVVYLWQQEDRKKDTIDFIKEYFSRSGGHKKTSTQYLQLFALGTSYCSYYDVVLRDYSSTDRRKVQLSQTLNEFGRELFEAVRENYDSLKSGVKHVVQMALVQTVKLCFEFDKEDMSKIEYGQEICIFSEEHFNQFFKNQIRVASEKLQKKLKRPKWWDDFIKDTYHVGDRIDGTVTSVQPYGIFVRFGKSYSGLLHISKVAANYTSSSELESLFKTGDSVSPIICGIDTENAHIRLSLIG